MKAEQKLHPTVIDSVRQAIEEAGGNEVFCVGTINREGLVEKIRIAARGDEASVPALRPYIEKSDVVIHNHPSGGLTPSKADLAVASSIGNQGIGFFIVDNSVRRIYVVAEPITLKERIGLDSVALTETLKPGGRLSQILSSYEERTSQIDMLAAVCESFNRERLCIAEAGTGVGKSLAYLIPALKWVVLNEERVVVSTATINLQQQLLEKDIPLVKRILEVDPKIVLVKGRGNYLCLRRLAEVVEENTLLAEQDEELKAIGQWASSSETGSRSDLSFYPTDSVWARVCSEADSCHGLYCRMREQCFVLKSRREAASAKLLVVNHHLLFSDLAVRMSGMGFESTAVLPPFGRIVFDEAHNVESSATSFFSDSFSHLTLRKYLGRLYRKNRGRLFGIMRSIRKLLPQIAADRAKAIPEAVEQIVEYAEILDTQAQILLSEENNLLLKRVLSHGDPIRLRSLLIEPLGELVSRLLKLVYLVEEILGLIPEQESENEAVFECRLILSRLRQVAEMSERLQRFEEFPQEIFWIERVTGYTGERYVRFVITPLDIAPLMKEALFEQYSCLIFTSATLTVKDSFEYWKSRIGLSDLKIELAERCFLSPFDYRHNVLLAIPRDAPIPSEEGYQSYASDIIREVLEISEGRALVLFTSYSMLNDTFDAIQPSLRQQGINIFKQGDDDRNRLLVKFREDTASVLFATHSFWEGVDTPGESLQILVLCRLPFKVPTDPILLARTEAIESRGGNPFLELSLPDAAIKLKQGFGRLMRRGSDWGIVLILDSRIVKKTYGLYFLGSLPETAQSIKEKRYLIEDIENFLAEKQGKN
jgi:ATP-dependent DNA helicase DinG